MELEQIQSQEQVRQDESEQIKYQLTQTETLLEQTQHQLREMQVHHDKTLSYYSAHVKNLIGILWETIPQERMDVILALQGSIQQSARIASVAEYCAQGWAGDLIEIGCFLGGTTVKLAEVAKKYNRRMIALDPWQLGTQNCHGGEYETFLKNTEAYRDVIDIVRSDSLDPQTIDKIKNKQLCFAFVDGLHTYEACLQDIQTVAHCFGVIAVDDTTWSPDVVRAFREGSALTNRSSLCIPVLRESYLLWA